MINHQNIFITVTQPYALCEITKSVQAEVEGSKIFSGICTIFIRHTSASLIIQENADPTAKHDLENWLRRLVPEADPNFTHTFEGSDDMPSHIKSALTATTLSIPVIDGKLTLGTWQGIYIWEHRARSHQRELVVCIQGQ